MTQIVNALRREESVATRTLATSADYAFPASSGAWPRADAATTVATGRRRCMQQQQAAAAGGGSVPTTEPPVTAALVDRLKMQLLQAYDNVSPSRLYPYQNDVDPSQTAPVSRDAALGNARRTDSVHMQPCWVGAPSLLQRAEQNKVSRILG